MSRTLKIEQFIKYATPQVCNFLKGFLPFCFSFMDQYFIFSTRKKIGRNLDYEKYFTVKIIRPDFDEL